MKLSDYWEKEASPSYAHLIDEKGRGLGEGSKVLELFKDTFLERIDFKNKTVIDYGLGGGWLGRYLFRNKEIKKYIGIDVAKRSLEVAENVLNQWVNQCKFCLTPVQFKHLRADIFISLACIQHFPSKDYLLGFLDNVDTSDIPDVVLQIRNGETDFNGAYEAEGDVGRACRTTPEFVSKYLPGYSLEFASEANPKSGYQYLVFKKVS